MSVYVAEEKQIPFYRKNFNFQCIWNSQMMAIALIKTLKLLLNS